MEAGAVPGKHVHPYRYPVLLVSYVLSTALDQASTHGGNKATERLSSLQLPSLMTLCRLFSTSRALISPAIELGLSGSAEVHSWGKPRRTGLRDFPKLPFWSTGFMVEIITIVEPLPWYI